MFQPDCGTSSASCRTEHRAASSNAERVATEHESGPIGNSGANPGNSGTNSRHRGSNARNRSAVELNPGNDANESHTGDDAD